MLPLGEQSTAGAMRALQILELEAAIEQRALADGKFATGELTGRRGPGEMSDNGAQGVHLGLGLAEALGGGENRWGGDVRGHDPMTTAKR